MKDVGLLDVRISPVKFLSEGDETSLFTWFRSIKSIVNEKGAGESLVLSISKQQLTEADMRELLALFSRYHLDLKLLRPLITVGFKPWIENKKAYWHADL